MNIGLEAYFARPDTPMAGSPVGLAMQELLIMRPDLSLEEARQETNETEWYASPKRRAQETVVRIGPQPSGTSSLAVDNRQETAITRAADQPSIQYAA